KGAERGIATEGVTTLGYPCSISETFLRKNQNQTIEECYRVLRSIKTKADNAGLDVVVYISMAFGNPYGDPWDENEVRQAIERLISVGIRSDRKSTRLNSSHRTISYAVFCLKKKKY